MSTLGNSDHQPHLLTRSEAADFLGVCSRTVTYLVSRGQLDYVKVGRSTRFDLVDLQRFVDRNRRKRRNPQRSGR